MNNPAILVLADGTEYDGISIGAAGECIGEMVFNTSMTGYQEILSDPSYSQQIVTLTTAHVGNTGCNSEDMESNRIWAAGLVIRNYSSTTSNYRSEISLSDWLKTHGIVAIANIDTRDLTLRLRSQGAITGCISTEINNKDQILQKIHAFQGLKGIDLAIDASRKTIERWHTGLGIWGENSMKPRFHVVAYDFGVKHNILKILYEKGCHITLVPATTSVAEALALNPDGIFLSNGPGDPEACVYAIEATREFLHLNIPLFGICLGFQILALASGGITQKMKFGHHGANHPVIETSGEKRVFITSQNHGFTVNESKLPECLQITHRSLFDNTLQGIKHLSKPAFGFQGHPEASPGPHDINIVFDEFINSMSMNSK